MMPLGRKKQRFPSKVKQWLGKGVLMWWENNIPPNKTLEKRESLKRIQEEINETTI